MTLSSHDALAHAFVSEQVWERYPDYRVHLMTVEGLGPVATTDGVEQLLAAAEHFTARRAESTPIDQWPEIVAWRDAFLGFGVKHRVARSSVEALVRRASAGLPRINAVTDVYNAVSMAHLVPVGGEDLNFYDGPPRLVIADGTEHFDTRENGEAVLMAPEPGEIIWRDNAGATCRRWNWRQTMRTRLTDNTARALFILDGLGPESEERLSSAANELSRQLQTVWPSCTIMHRTIHRGA